MTTSLTPTLWFAPPDMTLNQASPAGQQFMSLFSDPGAWQVTAGASTGLVLSEAFVLTATDQQLTQVFSFLSQHHLKLMMVTAMIPVQANGSGNGLEGFTSGSQLSNAVQRISRLGGTLDSVAMDGPLVAGHEASNGPQLSITNLAQQVAGNVALIKAAFPNVQFEDGEGLIATQDLAAWTQAFKAATGSAIAQIDADVNWSAPGVTGQLEAYAQAVRATGAVFGITGDSTTAFTTDQSWALAAETNIAAALADPLIRPDNIQVETWDPNPTVTLPEGLSGTLSHVALEAAEVAPLYAAGTLTGGTGVAASTVVPTPSYVGSALDAVAGAAVAVPGVKLTATGAAAAAATFAVVVTDVSGALGATGSGAGHVSGEGSNVLVLTGGLADINAELASLTYTGGAAGTDTIDVTTYDGAGLVDDHQINVAVAAPLAVPLPNGMSAAVLYKNIFGGAASTAVLAAAQARLAAGQTLAQVTAPWIAQAQATISALCEQVQGVSPIPAMLASLTEALADGASVAQIRTALAGAVPVQSELTALYQNHFGQAPTAAQLAALTQQLTAGASLQAVEAPLLANSQAEAQVTTLYQQVQGQAPDTTDLAAQARALLTGTPLATIREQLAEAAVVQANLSALFQHVYDVPPTATQLASLTAELAGTTSYAQIQAQFTQVAQATVTACYNSVLARNPTAAELALYTQRLTAGVLEGSSILGQLAFSAESSANVTAMYQQVIGQAPPQSMVTTLEQCLSIGQIPLVQLRADLATAATRYQQITGQPATAATLSPLMYDFLNKCTVDQICFSVAHSAQENQAIAGTFQSLFGHGMSYSQLSTLEAALQAGTTTMPAVQSSLAAQAAVDVPVLSNVVTSQYNNGNTWIAPFGAINVADPDPAAIETATVTVTGGDGHLAKWGTSTNAAGTVFIRTGSASMLSNDLRSLVLIDPTGGKTATLTLTLQNATGHSSTASVTVSTQALQSPATTDFVFMPAGNDTVTAGGGQTFVFSANGFGQETIASFNISNDVIQLSKSMVAAFANVLPLEASVGGATIIRLGPSESISLPGITPSSLHAADFRFV